MRGRLGERMEGRKGNKEGRIRVIILVLLAEECVFVDGIPGMFAGEEGRREDG